VCLRAGIDFHRRRHYRQRRSGRSIQALRTTKRGNIQGRLA
jgi:hypothetical protein